MQVAFLQKKSNQKRKRFSPLQAICLSFVFVIATGTAALLLPISTYQPISLVDALFTATSATCVTGLVVMDTYTAFTPFGQVVILLLIQVGGLGLVTLTSFFALAVRRRMGFHDLLLINESVSTDSFSQSTAVLRLVVRLALFFEVLGALLLMLAFVPMFGLEGIWISVFIAISAFCNAGFDLFGQIAPYSSLTAFVDCYYIQAVIMFLIMAGGLGFLVWLEIGQWRQKRHFSLHAKIVFAFSAVLWVGGAVALLILEWENPATLGALSLDGKIMASLFQSVSTRTAGFNTVDLAACEPLSKLLMCFLMFIGAAPGGTGGGIKITTFAVLFLTVGSVARGRSDCVINGRHIRHTTVYRAFSITVLGVIAVLVSTLFAYTHTAVAVTGVDALFEAVSAFATVGLSVGVTGVLTFGAKIAFMFVMFVGRVGPVTLAISLAARPDTQRDLILPEGHINVG